MEGYLRIGFSGLLFVFKVVMDELDEVELLAVMVAMVLLIAIIAHPQLLLFRHLRWRELPDPSRLSGRICHYCGGI